MRDLCLRRVAPVVSVVSVVCSILGSVAPAAAQKPPSAAPAAASAAPPPPAQPPLAAPPPAPPGAAPPAAAPPAAYAYPPPQPGYAYPPPQPGYAYPPPPPGYGYPPPQYGVYPKPPPTNVPYEGGPVPTGYHLEERPRRGLIISGSLVMGIPWALGVAIVSGSDFPNQTGWLVVPALGPWLTLATRHTSNSCNYNSTASVCVNDSLDSATRTVLVLDGLMQTAGAIMLVVGLASPKKVMVRDFVGSLHFAPAPLGKHGYGGFVTGEF